jgi:hypothetical protein
MLVATATDGHDGYGGTAADSDRRSRGACAEWEEGGAHAHL